MGPTVCVPEVAIDPLQPPAPLQVVAFVVLHVSVVEPPEFTCVGDAEMETPGALAAELPGRR